MYKVGDHPESGSDGGGKKGEGVRGTDNMCWFQIVCACSVAKPCSQVGISTLVSSGFGLFFETWQSSTHHGVFAPDSKPTKQQ